MDTCSLLPRTGFGRRTTVVAVTVALATISACAPSPYTTSKTHVIRQEAMVQAPTGPPVGGPMVEGETLALHGRIFGAPVGAGDERTSGETGHVVFDRGLGFRFSTGYEFLEFGLGSSMVHSEFAKPIASDIDRDSVRSALAVSIDPHLRIELAKTSRVSFYGIAEMRGRIIPYDRRIHTTSERTTYENEYGPRLDSYQYDTTEFAHTEEETKRKPVLLPAGGLGATLRLSENVLVSLGAYAQQAPVFFGQKVVHEFCHSPTGYSSDEECTGDSPEDVDALHRTLIGSGFGSVDLQFGATMVRLQAFYHAASPSEWPEHTPGGGQISVRQTF